MNFGRIAVKYENPGNEDPLLTPCRTNSAWTLNIHLHVSSINILHKR